MKLLWVCNTVPGDIQRDITGKAGSAFWVDHVLSDIRCQGIRLHVLCRGGETRGSLDAQCSYTLFPEVPPYQYSAQTEQLFLQEVQAFQPDVIHIWGSEYSHTLAMVNAAEKAGILGRVVISIQGLCSIYERHHNEGVPERVVHGYTFRDLLRRNNLERQQKIFGLRGDFEVKALQKASHVIGRTAWDKGCMEAINPDARYHFCNETLRDPFYQDGWHYDSCQKHRIFASSCSYPIKGFHYLLEAFAQILKFWPDATLAVPGRDVAHLEGWKQKLRESSYERYLRQLICEYGLEGRVEFLGGLSAEQMKEQYLRANVFVLPSTIENSPNSLGEAMLLGVPCVAADVGGVTTMMTHEKEGFIYQSTAPYMLAHYIDRVFTLEDQAEHLGTAAKAHASRTHDPQTNLKTLLEAYHAVSSQ